MSKKMKSVHFSFGKIITISILTFLLITSCNVTDPKKDKPKPEGYQEDIPWPSLAGVPWPMHHGNPQSNGRSKEIGHLEGRVEWKIEIPVTGYMESILSPIVGKDGTIYFVSFKDIEAPGGFLYAVTPEGNVKWRYPLSTNKNTSPPILSAEGNIYVADWANNISCIRTDGSLKWEFTIPRPITSIMNIDKEGNIYGIALDGILYSFSKSGDIRWQLKIGDKGSTSNSISFAPSGDILYLNCNYGLFGITTEGEIKWEYLRNFLGDYTVPLVTSQGKIFTYSGLFPYNIDGTRDTLLGGKIYEAFEKDFGYNYIEPTIDKNGNLYIAGRNSIASFDYSGNVRWKISKLIIQDSFGIVCDIAGNLYYMQKDHHLVCMNSEGLIIWKLLLDGESYYSPAFHIGRLYLGTVLENKKYFYSIM